MNYEKIDHSGLEELYGLALAYFETIAEWQSQDKRLGDPEATKFHLQNIREMVKRFAPPFSKYGRGCCGNPIERQCKDCPMIPFNQAFMEKQKAAGVASGS